MLKKVQSLPIPFPALLCFIILLLVPTTTRCQLPDGLRLARDSQGEYASYILKKSDTVWGSVVMKYVNPDKRNIKTVEAILKRSGIKDAKKMRVGAEIKVPLSYLASDVKPVELKKSKPLRGVVVILDPGHGGIDSGARGKGRVYEDEVVYDVAVRLKNMLETNTSAQVYMTLRDRSRGNSENHGSSFPLDQDEYITTTPSYYVKNTTIALHLRWYLANSIYRRKLREGISSSKIVFISIHADSLGARDRGTMVYYPNAYLCRKGFSSPGSTLRKFSEVRESPNVSFSYQQRANSESSSRRFANAVITSLRRNNIRIFNNKPVRDRIIRRSQFVPAVLKYNAVPTKILVETVNLRNRTDTARIRSASFRALYAKSLLEAILNFYD